MISSFLVVVHVFVCILLIAIVLLQQGKGASIGAAFGGGGNTVFGASGADNLLTRLTTVSAVIFMVTSVALAISGKQIDLTDGSIGSLLPEKAVTQELKDESGAVASDVESTASQSDESSQGEKAAVVPSSESPSSDAVPEQSSAPAEGGDQVEAPETGAMELSGQTQPQTAVEPFVGENVTEVATTGSDSDVVEPQGSVKPDESAGGEQAPLKE